MSTKETQNHPAFIDTACNIYRVENTYTGVFVTIRTNPGGHRKRVKSISESKAREQAWLWLDAHALAQGWQVFVPGGEE